MAPHASRTKRLVRYSPYSLSSFFFEDAEGFAGEVRIVNIIVKYEPVPNSSSLKRST